MKVSNFAERFVLGYLLRNNVGPREIQTMKLAGDIKRGRKGVECIEHLPITSRDLIGRKLSIQYKILPFLSSIIIDH